MGHVYILVQIDHKGGETYKIGITKNDPAKRVLSLQTGNPNEIRVLNSYTSDNYKKIEKILHNKYFKSKTSVQNEWFNLDDHEVLSFIEECTKADALINLLLKENHFYK